MTTAAAIRTLVEQYPGRFSVELRINLSSGRSPEIFKWFLASVLFGTRISENIVKQTFRQFSSRNVVALAASTTFCPSSQKNLIIFAQHDHSGSVDM